MTVHPSLAALIGIAAGAASLAGAAEAWAQPRGPVGTLVCRDLGPAQGHAIRCENGLTYLPQGAAPPPSAAGGGVVIIQPQPAPAPRPYVAPTVLTEEMRDKFEQIMLDFTYEARAECLEDKSTVAQTQLCERRLIERKVARTGDYDLIRYFRTEWRNWR